MTDEMHGPTVERLRDALKHRADAAESRRPALTELISRGAEGEHSARQHRSWWRRHPIAVALAALLTAGGGAAAVANLPAEEMIGTASPTNPGGSLHCSGVELMRPSQAEAFLRDRGYEEVQWNYVPAYDSMEMLLERPPDSALVTGVTPLSEDEVLILAEDYREGFPTHERLVRGETLCDDPPLPGRTDVLE